MIKLIIADDQQLIRESLKIILSTDEDFNVIDLVADGNELMESVKKEVPDIILMDVRMPGMDGVECTRLIKESYPDIQVIILTTFDDDEYIFDALKYGASGYLLKGCSFDELSKAIHSVLEGGAMFNPAVAGKVAKFFSQLANQQPSMSMSTNKDLNLSETEWKIIEHVSQGASNKEISAYLQFTEGTIRNYLSVILDKLELRDRTQLAIWYLKKGSR